MDPSYADRTKRAVERYNPRILDVAQSIASMQADLAQSAQRQRMETNPEAAVEAFPILPIPWRPCPDTWTCICLRLWGRWLIGNNTYCVGSFATCTQGRPATASEVCVFTTLVLDVDVIGQRWMLPEAPFVTPRPGMTAAQSAGASMQDNMTALRGYPAPKYPTETFEPPRLFPEDLLDMGSKMLLISKHGRTFRSAAGMPGLPLVPPYPVAPALAPPPTPSDNVNAVAANQGAGGGGVACPH